MRRLRSEIYDVLARANISADAVIYIYTDVLSGFSARLTDAQVHAAAAHTHTMSMCRHCRQGPQPLEGREA